MTVGASPGDRFRRLLLFRQRGSTTQVLRVLEDHDGWLYVVNLAGTVDFGPYLKDEISSAFDVEAEHCAERDLVADSCEADQPSSRGAAPEHQATHEGTPGAIEREISLKSPDELPLDGDVYGSRVEHRAELAARYPEQFSGADLGISWPDGWHALVSDVCAFAAEHRIPVRWLQIKEKLGGLRMHTQRGPSQDISTSERDDTITEAHRAFPSLSAKIAQAEEASLRTCCLCGSSDPAARVGRRSFSGWWLTVCDACAPKVSTHYARTTRRR